jgi:hypothetical protein
MHNYSQLAMQETAIMARAVAQILVRKGVITPEELDQETARQRANLDQKIAETKEAARAAQQKHPGSKQMAKLLGMIDENGKLKPQEDNDA